ncbi:MAG: hypothetical protein C4557_07520 [Anaerolineaceae bacterium]|jgi:hypothetical protein|nr:MAG: hypothetical protein C4557_07520 [Anaerolineaceae bacterium]
MNRKLLLILAALLGMSLMLGACGRPETAVPVAGTFEPAGGPPPVEETPAPSSDDEGIPLGVKIVIGIAVILVLWSWLSGGGNVQWQSQASDKKPPTTCQEGTYYVHRESVSIKAGLWKLTALNIIIDPASSQPAAYIAPANLINQINQSARNKRLGGKPAEIKKQTVKIGKGLTPLVVSCQTAANTKKRDFSLEARFEGGEASAKFARYRCMGTPGSWQKESEWTATLKTVDSLRKTFRNQQSGETKKEYKMFLDDRLSSYVLDVIEEAAKIL